MSKQYINKDFYNKNARSWTDMKTNSFFHENEFKDFCNYFDNEDSIIDIGCASGIHVPLFLGIGRNLKYEGLDISESFIGIAKSRYPHLKFHLADILDELSLPKTIFDGFWAGAALMHIPDEDWTALLNNIEKLVKKGGVGYMSLPTKRPNPENENDKRIFSYWDKSKLNLLLEERGWKILKSSILEDSNRDENIWQGFIVKLPE